MLNREREGRDGDAFVVEVFRFDFFRNAKKWLTPQFGAVRFASAGAHPRNFDELALVAFLIRGQEVVFVAPCMILQSARFHG
jgi:hypothetical protein